MQIKTKAIVLSALKFNEKSLIVKCFTLSDGLKSYFVPNAFSLKKNNQKIAYFQPLTLLEIEANHKNKGTLEYFKEIKIATPFFTINTNVYKATIVLFVSEILSNSITEEEKNENMFLYFETALLWLDHHNDFSNFHLMFLLEITKFLGFYPDTSVQHYDYFELIDGVFSPLQGVNCLTAHETLLFKKLLDLKFSSDQKVFSGIERQILLKILLAFYGFHLAGFKQPKSLEVLKEVFA